jgi:hypothetical protein
MFNQNKTMKTFIVNFQQSTYDYLPKDKSFNYTLDLILFHDAISTYPRYRHDNLKV